MSYFTSAKDLQAELLAFLQDFVESDEGARAADAARVLSEEVTLVVRTREPDAALSVDFVGGSVALGAMTGAAAEVEIDADALHDLMLNRLGPVEISRLNETEQIGLIGAPDALAALVLVATVIQPFYPASLERRGRRDLLETVPPPTRIVWQAEDGPPKQLIGTRRPWQRQSRAAEPAATA